MQTLKRPHLGGLQIDLCCLPDLPFDAEEAVLRKGGALRLMEKIAHGQIQQSLGVLPPWRSLVDRLLLRVLLFRQCVDGPRVHAATYVASIPHACAVRISRACVTLRSALHARSCHPIVRWHHQDRRKRAVAVESAAATKVFLCACVMHGMILRTRLHLLAD